MPDNDNQQNYQPSAPGPFRRRPIVAYLVITIAMVAWNRVRIVRSEKLKVNSEK